MLEGTGDWFGEKLLTYVIDGKSVKSLAGDVNLDRQVSISDAVLLMRLVSESNRIPVAYSLENSDLNNDGMITILDTMKTLELITE